MFHDFVAIALGRRGHQGSTLQKLAQSVHYSSSYSVLADFTLMNQGQPDESGST